MTTLTSARTTNAALPYFALGGAVLFMALSPIIIRAADAPAPVIAFYRMILPSMVLAIPFARQVAPRHDAPGGTQLALRGVGFAVLAGLFFTCDLMLWINGVALSGATNPTLLANTAPVWVAFGAILFLRERLGLLFWLGLGLALAGSAIILGGDLRREALVGLGSLMGLGASFFYAGYFLFLQRSRESLATLPAYWLLTATSAIVLMVIVLATGGGFTGYTPQTWFLLIAHGVVVQLLAHMLVSYALGHLPASLVSPTLLLQPALAGVLAGPLLGEWLVPGQILGGLALLLGVFLVHRSRHSANKTNE